MDAPRAPRDASATAAHLVGGLLLGAALLALVQFFVPLGVGQPLAALVLSFLAIVASRAAELRRAAPACEAGYAAGLVAAGALPFFASTTPSLSLVALVLVLGVTLLRRARTPLALAAVVAAFLAARHATQVDLLGERSLGAAALFALALVAYGALLLAQRRAPWASAALAAQAIALGLAAFPLLDALGVTDAGVAALALGGLFAALFALGVALDERPLVLVASALLLCAAVAFAFLALGPALAAIVLLLGGGAILWQAEAMRGPRAHAPEA